MPAAGDARNDGRRLLTPVLEDSGSRGIGVSSVSAAGCQAFVLHYC
jgi:hypothetical protein